MIRALIPAACASLALAFPAAGADAPKCRLLRVAEWPVKLERGLPIIEGAINGKKVGILLDTGAVVSLVTKDSAAKLGLPTKGTGDYLLGTGGESRVLATRLDELRIGDAVRKNMGVRVAGERPIRGVDFILGDDFFKNLDLEFDYPKGVIRLFHAKDCKGTRLGYWDANALEVPLEGDGRIVFPVKINGRDASAMLDSGAAGSVVSLSFAGRLGITQHSPGVAPSQCAMGIGQGIVASWVARFESVAIGAQAIRNPNLLIQEILPELEHTRYAAPELILGTDFLRAHRVLVARSQEKVYFSYTGGLVFPAIPTLACAGDQGDAPDVRQALAQARKGDAAGTLAALDAAVRKQPNDVVALYTRAAFHEAGGQLEKALADIDAAIANGMRNGGAFIFRAMIRTRQEDYERAILDFDEALKLDPTHRQALRARAWLHFLTERDAAAEQDLAKVMDVDPLPHDALWLHVSRARRGLDARAALERALASLQGGAWPAPVLSYYLGRLDADALLAAAEGAAEKDRKVHVCEARYYVAQRRLAEGAKADARGLLEKVAAECPHEHIEYSSAVIQLGKLR